jgi:hypothetical protein
MTKLWRLDGAGTWEGDKSVLDLKIGRKSVSVSGIRGISKCCFKAPCD